MSMFWPNILMFSVPFSSLSKEKDSCGVTLEIKNFTNIIDLQYLLHLYFISLAVFLRLAKHLHLPYHLFSFQNNTISQTPS